MLSPFHLSKHQLDEIEAYIEDANQKAGFWGTYILSEDGIIILGTKVEENEMTREILVAIRYPISMISV